jgi:hypothetical protein
MRTALRGQSKRVVLDGTDFTFDCGMAHGAPARAPPDRFRVVRTPAVRPGGTFMEGSVNRLTNKQASKSPAATTGSRAPRAT